MQAAVHHMPPHVLPYPPLNRLPNPPSAAIQPTPPVTGRKRKRPTQYTVSYSEVQEVDSAGRVRDVIVIEDTPPPSTISPATTHTQLYSASLQPPIYSAPIQTRARAAAAAQALSASTSSTTTAGPPASKKRKRDPVDVAGTAGKRPAVNGHLQPAASVNTPWASGSAAATDEVRFSRIFGLRDADCLSLS